MRVLWLALAIGCGGSGTTAPPPEPSPPARTAPPIATAPASCAERIDRIDKQLRALATRLPGFVPNQRDIRAPASAAGKPFDRRGFVLAVTRSGKLILQGNVLESSRHAFEYLDSMSKRALEYAAMSDDWPRERPFPLYLWADREVPIATLAELGETIKATGDRWAVRLLVAAPPLPPVPMPSAATAEIASKQPATEPDGTGYLVERLKRSIEGCPTILTELAVAAGEVPWVATEKLIAGIPRGLRGCECKLADADLFEWGAYEWFGASAPALAWIEMPRLTKGDRKPLSAIVQ